MKRKLGLNVLNLPGNGLDVRTQAAEKTVVLTSTEVQIDSYLVTAYKGIAQGHTWDDFLRNAEAIGANAVLNICFDDALDVDTLFHGTGVVLKPLKFLLVQSVRSTALETEIATARSRADDTRNYSGTWLHHFCAH